MTKISFDQLSIRLIDSVSFHNTFVSDILYNTFVTIPLYTIPYTGIPGMIAQADLGGSGETNCDEFYRIMKAKGNFLEDLSSDDDF